MLDQPAIYIDVQMKFTASKIDETPAIAIPSVPSML
jgi:hypothetical protein